jgi:hypothetical protein
MRDEFCLGKEMQSGADVTATDVLFGVTMRFMLESERADSLLRARASTTTSLPSLLCHGHFLERARLQDSDVREARIAIKYRGKLQTRYVAKMDAVRCTKEFVQPCEDASAGCARMPGAGRLFGPQHLGGVDSHRLDDCWQRR